MSAMQGLERAIDNLSVRRLQPHNTNPQKEREKKKTIEYKKGADVNEKTLALLLKPASSIPVSKIIYQRYWEGNESPTVLRDSAARRRI